MSHLHVCTARSDSRHKKRNPSSYLFCFTNKFLFSHSLSHSYTLALFSRALSRALSRSFSRSLARSLSLALSHKLSLSFSLATLGTAACCSVGMVVYCWYKVRHEISGAEAPARRSRMMPDFGSGVLYTHNESFIRPSYALRVCVRERVCVCGTFTACGTLCGWKEK